jgi:hypothetical protein
MNITQESVTDATYVLLIIGGFFAIFGWVIAYFVKKDKIENKKKK